MDERCAHDDGVASWRLIDHVAPPQNRQSRGLGVAPPAAQEVARSLNDLRVRRSKTHNHRYPASAWWSRREAESRCLCHQIGQGVGLHLPHDTAPVRLHGDLANAKVVPDLLIQKA